MKLPISAKIAHINVEELREHGGELRNALMKRAASAKGVVVERLHAVRPASRRGNDADEEERLPARPIMLKGRTPTRSIIPTANDISDDVLDRMFVDEPAATRRPTSLFFQRQRARAGMTPSIPSSPQQSLYPVRKQPPPRSHVIRDRGALSPDDLIYMFAGAPYFDVEHADGRLKPRVVFGWGPAVEESKYAVDHKVFAHMTFELCTRDRARRPKTQTEHRDVREVPSMRSAQGCDPGTVGYTHFLEMDLPEPPSMDHGSRRTRQQIIMDEADSIKLCEFDLENIMHRLAELGKVFEMLHEGNGDPREWSARMIEEIGEDLFSTFLSGDLGCTEAGTGSVSLLTQATALQKVLSTDNLWYDFSYTSERERLARIMWEDAPAVAGEITEREVLMLQLALSAELAVRLEIATRLAACDFRYAGIFAPTDLDSMLAKQNDKLSWDVVVFRRFIYSYEAVTNLPPASKRESRNPLLRASWNSAILSESSFAQSTASEVDLIFRPQHGQEQLDGLRAFAAGIDWTALGESNRNPSAHKSDSLLSPEVPSRPISGVTEYDTPPTSPTFPNWLGLQNLELDKESRRVVTRSLDDEATNPSTMWRARMWLSGFVMPGKNVSRMLMDACLEHSPSAQHLLQNRGADGFVFKHKMFWSQDTVVSRVLAPTEGVRECMGWLSVPFVPQGRTDGWIRVSLEPESVPVAEPRIQQGDQVVKASDPLRGFDASQLQTGHFHQPLDSHLVSGNEAQFEGVSLQPSDEDGSAFIVNLTLKSPNNDIPALTVPLTHSVHFVSSYPCYPYMKRRRPTSPAAYDSHAPTDSGHSSPVSSLRDKELPLPPAHPLHIDYTYTVVPAAALLSSANKETDCLILINKSSDKPQTYHIEDEDVVVLDCRGNADLEVLARAWCAKTGLNAVIGNSDRTCLACCIREAMALSIGVVIRT